MTAFRHFLQSPLARHPELFARKVAERLHLYREKAGAPAPPLSSVLYPDHWAPALRAWMQEVPLHPAPHSFNRVFGHDFDEALLLRLCREGPRAGERDLTGDIKLIWDYSRGQPLFTNAAAGPANLAECAAFVRRWLEANNDLNGPAWTCAMDVAIRAVNWIFADALFHGELGRQLGSARWSSWLWRHGWVIWRRLEARLVSSNHYLADLLGLALIGAIFPDDAPARAWLRFAQAEFPRALVAQTRRDGGLNEASLRYHAFVTEMALLFRLALGSAFAPDAESRLRAMCRIVADFQDATGDVFPIGDDDSGRILAVDFASPSGRAEILLRLASSLTKEKFSASATGVYPESGWWIRRAGDFTVALDFGGVGLNGLGAHAHNDDFAFCLEWRHQPVFVDPGTFLYTPDREARNRFRSTFCHNTLVLDGREQRELSREPFYLPGLDDACGAKCLEDGTWAFKRPLAAGISHRREVLVREGEVLIRDVVEGAGRHRLQWRFQLHPSVLAKPAPQGFALTVPQAGALWLEMKEPTVAFEIADAEFSPAYGWRQATRACVAQGEFMLPCSVEWTTRPGEAEVR